MVTLSINSVFRKVYKMEYLTEKKLGTYLTYRYGTKQVKSQFTVSNGKRVDYLLSGVPFNFETNTPSVADVIVEFDGERHYRENSVIQRDLENQRLLIKQGFHVIHVPYFVQAEFVFPFYFNTTEPSQFIQNSSAAYPNGFVDSKCLRPIDFSYGGWRRFVYEIRRYPTPIREQIYDTMSDDEMNIFAEVSSKMDTTEVLYDSLLWVSSCMFG